MVRSTEIRRWLWPLLPVLALLANLWGKLCSCLPASAFMPAFYRLMAVRAPSPDKEPT